MSLLAARLTGEEEEGEGRPLRHYVDLSSVKDEPQAPAPVRQLNAAELLQQRRDAKPTRRVELSGRQRAEALGLTFGDAPPVQRSSVPDGARDAHAAQLTREAEQLRYQQEMAPFVLGPKVAPPSFAQLAEAEQETANGGHILRHAFKKEEDAFVAGMEKCPFEGDLTDPARGVGESVAALDAETRSAGKAAAPVEVQVGPKKRSLEDCEKDLEAGRRGGAKNYNSDFGRYTDFCSDCLDANIPENKWKKSAEGFGAARMLPPFSLVILKKFGAWLLKEYSRATLVQYRYAINYSYEQAGLGRPWKNKADGGDGWRLFDQEMKHYSQVRAEHDDADGRKRAKGGAKRVNEDGVRCLLILAEKRAAVVVENNGDTVNMKSTQEQENDLRLFGHSMLMLTMIVCILRSCSTVWPPDLSTYLSFSESGTMKLLVYFWKETSAHSGAEEPEQIQIPWADQGGDDHPRNRYLSLMRVLLEREGTLSFVQNEAATEFFEGSLSNREARTRNRTKNAVVLQGPNGKKLGTAVASQIGELAISAWGGKAAMDEIDVNLSITGHTMRKTGASAALNTGANESLVVQLGMWSSNSGVPKAYKEPKYVVTRFFLQMFDWLRS